MRELVFPVKELRPAGEFANHLIAGRPIERSLSG